MYLKYRRCQKRPNGGPMFPKTDYGGRTLTRPTTQTISRNYTNNNKPQGKTKNLAYDNILENVMMFAQFYKTFTTGWLLFGTLLTKSMLVAVYFTRFVGNSTKTSAINDSLR